MKIAVWRYFALYPMTSLGKIALQTSIQKNKENFGSFFFQRIIEVTMKSTMNNKINKFNI